jgi:hypothetical protein
MSMAWMGWSSGSGEELSGAAPCGTSGAEGRRGLDGPQWQLAGPWRYSTGTDSVAGRPGLWSLVSGLRRPQMAGQVAGSGIYSGYL